MRQVVYVSDQPYDPEVFDLFRSVHQALHHQGLSALLVTPACDRACDPYIEQAMAHGMTHVHGPHARIASSGHSHLELIKNSFAFSTTQGLVHVLRFWRRLFELEQPALVVTESGLPALLAARTLGIATAVIDLGFLMPELSLAPLAFESVVLDREPTPADQSRLQNDEHWLLERANAALKQVGAWQLKSWQLKSWQDLWACDQLMRLTTPEIAALPSLSHHDCMGLVARRAVGGHPWPESDGTRPKIAVSLKPNVAISHKVVEVLGRYQASHVGLHMPFVQDEVFAPLPHLWRIRERDEFWAALAHADLIIAHPDHAVLAQATLHGKPLLLVPVTTEHQLRTRRLFIDGRGLYLSALDRTPAAIEKKIVTLLAGPMYTAKARQARATVKLAQADQIAAPLLAAINRAPVRKKSVRSQTCHVLKPRDFDTIFLSFDEPNADHHWAQLQKQVPHAKRVHGVVGFDASHKAAAAVAETERLTIIDADNLVDPAFFEIEQVVPPHLQEAVWTWTSQNDVNGLVYPFGGVKIWTKDIINTMRSHELAQVGDGLKLDFWDQPGYYVFHRCFSLNVTSGSPYQAFRGGYREGVKATGWGGMVRTADDLHKVRGTVQFKRLWAWMSLGADVPNGAWAMLGARLGCLAAVSPNFQSEKINDYAWFENFWRGLYREVVDASLCEQTAMGLASGPVHTAALATRLEGSRRQLASLSKYLAFDELSPAQSAQLKAKIQAKREPITDVFKPFGMYDAL